MGIAPISSIRPPTMIRPSPSAPDLSRVFEVEYLGHSADDEYTPANRKAVRGLEDEEEAESAVDEGGAGDSSLRAVGSRKVSFFA